MLIILENRNARSLWFELRNRDKFEAMICSLIGGPGVGKGTFAKIICSRLKLKHVSLGDILREKATDGSANGNEIKRIMNQGLLVPSDLAEGLITQNIKAALENTNLKGVLLDGHPRTIAEAEVLDATLRSFNIASSSFQVVNIKLETSVAVKRLLNRKQCVTCGESFNTADIVMDSYDMPAILPSRETCKLGDKCSPVLTTRGDDTEAAIKTRLQEHDVNVAPILAHYERQGLLRTFNVHKGAKDADALIKVILG